MTLYQAQAANEWSKSGLKQCLSPTIYKPKSLEKYDSTGIQKFLVERFFSCRDSGSWHDAAFSKLEETVAPIFGSWVVISLTPEKIAVERSTPSLVEKLTEIRGTFGLSMAALADILRASRASVYNWYENETPNGRFVQRIEKLYEIAQEWEKKNPRHYAPGRLMKQKLRDSPSMYERLCRERLDMQEISSGMEGLLQLMKKQRKRMDRAKARSAKAPTDTESQKDLLEWLTGSISADK